MWLEHGQTIVNTEYVQYVTVGEKQLASSTEHTLTFMLRNGNRVTLAYNSMEERNTAYHQVVLELTTQRQKLGFIS